VNIPGKLKPIMVMIKSYLKQRMVLTLPLSNGVG
jgi:hypothetical protein